MEMEKPGKSGQGKKQPPIDEKPYDSAFKTMAEKASVLLIPLINEVFRTKYPLDATMELLHDERHITDARTGEQHVIATDSYFIIDGCPYHIECQSVGNRRMVLWMIEYDFHIALDAATGDGGKWKMSFPRSAIVYLRKAGKNAAKWENVQVKMPDGGTWNYRVPVVRAQTFSKEELFEKQLLILVPFYIFRYERMFAKLEGNAAARAAFLADLRDLRDRLEKRKPSDARMERAYREVYERLDYVCRHFLQKRVELKQEVSAIMGGRILETKALDAWDAGMEKGRKEERTSAIRKIMEKMKYTAEQAMEFLDIPEADYPEYLAMLKA